MNIDEDSLRQALRDLSEATRGIFQVNQLWRSCKGYLFRVESVDDNGKALMRCMDGRRHTTNVDPLKSHNWYFVGYDEPLNS